MTPTPVATRAIDAGVDLIRADRLTDGVTEQVETLRPDLGVIVAYGGLVREPLLSLPRHGWINLHFSRLPRWRGAAPVQRAIAAGDDETAATVFQLVPQLDAGPVFAEHREAISHADTAGTLLARLAEIGASTLTTVVNEIADGTAVAIEQVGEPTFAPKLSAADGVVDWTAPAVEIDRLIRGVTPEPGASTLLDGERFKLLDVAVATSAPTLAPGFVDVESQRVIVGTGEGTLELRRVQPAGRTAMAAADWWRGRPTERPTVFA